MRLDVPRAVLETPVALSQVRGQELLDQALGVLVHEPWKRQLAGENQLVNLINRSEKKVWKGKSMYFLGLSFPSTTSSGRDRNVRRHDEYLRRTLSNIATSHTFATNEETQVSSCDRDVSRIMRIIRLMQSYAPPPYAERPATIAPF